MEVWWVWRVDLAGEGKESRRRRCRSHRRGGSTRPSPASPTRPKGCGDKRPSAALPLLDDVFNIAVVAASCIWPFLAATRPITLPPRPASDRPHRRRFRLRPGPGSQRGELRARSIQQHHQLVVARSEGPRCRTPRSKVTRRPPRASDPSTSSAGLGYACARAPPIIPPATSAPDRHGWRARPAGRWRPSTGRRGRSRRSGR